MQQAFISRIVKFRPDAFTAGVVVLSALGVVVVLAREAGYGVALHYDSINYIGVARSLASGDGFTEIYGEGRPYLHWPPLYPLLLAVAGLLVIDPYDVAGPLGAVVFGLTILIIGGYLLKRLESKYLALWCCAALTLSIPLSWMASWALSESVFILFVMVALIFMHKFLERGQSRWLLLWVAVFSALALLTRYLGIALVGLVLLTLLMQRGVAVHEKLKNVVMYALISMIPICTWMIRNYVISGDFTGSRSEYVRYSLYEIVEGAWLVLREWSSLFDSWYVSIALVVLVAGIVACMMVVVARTKDAKWYAWRPFYLFGGFAVAYVLVLVAAMMLGNTGNGVQPRFLVPAYIPVVVVLVFALDGFLVYERGKAILGRIDDLPWVGSASLLGLMLWCTLCAWLVYGVQLNIDDIERHISWGTQASYANATYGDSELLAYLHGSDFEGVMGSNVTAAVYIYTDSFNEHHYLNRDFREMEAWISSVNNDHGGVYVVWFHDWYANNLFNYDASDIEKLSFLELIAEFSDGVVFKRISSSG